MILKEILEINERIDRPGRPVTEVVSLLVNNGLDQQFITTTTIKEKKGQTDFIKISISGRQGKSMNGTAPTLGIIGRLGGIGARPEVIGLTSDADGALTALSIALKFARMHKNGDQFMGDIIIATHLCSNAPILPHEPVPLMGSPVEFSTMNRYEVDEAMDAIISIDTSRGNKIINVHGFAVTPTVKEGWILRVSEDVLQIMEYVTGAPPAVVPITMQDITPYDNGIYHFNSMLQPAVASSSPVVGVAITSIQPVPGYFTGVSSASQLDGVGRFVIEVAQAYGKGKLSFYDEEEFALLQRGYGPMNHLQKSPDVISSNLGPAGHSRQKKRCR